MSHTLFDTARIQFIDGEPHSLRFDDVYYSRENGLAESRYVFLEQNQLPQRFAAMSAQQTHCIAETGFGTGLNFLAACQCFLEAAPTTTALHYISIERFPLNRQELRQALSPWKELAEEVDHLLQHYPCATPGYHRLALFQGRVFLTLIFGDSGVELPRLAQRGQGPVDTWFLDGFAPSKNPDMWTSDLFSHMARLSAPQAHFATFTAAGFVRRGLTAAGFKVDKRPGFGRKRDMLAGYIEHDAASGERRYPFSDKPWFISAEPTGSVNGSIEGSKGESTHHSIKSVAIVGGGLAGCTTARVLAERGLQVTVFDRASEPASEASGNRAGVIYPSFSPHDSAQYRFYQQAYLHAVRQIGQWLDDDGLHWSRCGVLQLATDAKSAQQQEQLALSSLWPDEVLTAVDAKQASEIAHAAIHQSGLFFPQGGWLYPKALCRAALDHPNIAWRGDCDIQSLKRVEQQWHLQSQSVHTADAVVIANAGAAEPLLQAFDVPLPLRLIRGQVSRVKNSAESKALNTVICHKGYITPAIDGRHEIGATFNLKDLATELRLEDHQHNFDQLTHHLPTLSEHLPLSQHSNSEGRVGFRCQTPDYLPMIGRLPDAHFYHREYTALAKGMKQALLAPGQSQPRLFLNVAHGSRGITSSCLAAEIIASDLLGEPAPVDQECLNALHPARFLVRAIKRQR
ncbi:oxidoreductase, FAD-binding [gamma proteobacterium HTCC5015]|nr:oxidoreductase, FAD-binding [gamma proteobacterium HTCC5015]